MKPHFRPSLQIFCFVLTALLLENIAIVYIEGLENRLVKSFFTAHPMHVKTLIHSKVIHIPAPVKT